MAQEMDQEMAQDVLRLTVFSGGTCLGEAEGVTSEKHPHFQFPNNQIRIRYISQASRWCPPLAILHTMSPVDVRCKFKSDSPMLKSLHVSCFQGLKTAVVMLGDEEVHLVAMRPKRNVDDFVGFWCCAVPVGAYDSCKRMFNIRSLAIVFNLEGIVLETNTETSLTEKITSLRERINIAKGTESKGKTIPLLEQLSKYWLDKSMLYQFSNNRSILFESKKFWAQLEMVYQASFGDELIFRPVTRLMKDKNTFHIFLTRMDPEDPSTSVIVRLRPHWEDSRIFLTLEQSKPKRFELYVCTDEEPDLAFEIWRLLDPNQKIISSDLLEERIVGVPPGMQPKSLSFIFLDGVCHPKMAIVIDRSKDKWENKDKSQVYEIQVETDLNSLQLRIAKNTVCSVSQYFYEDIEERLLQPLSRVCYEDDVVLPPAPDVGNILKNIVGAGQKPTERKVLVPVPEASTSQQNVGPSS